MVKNYWAKIQTTEPSPAFEAPFSWKHSPVSDRRAERLRDDTGWHIGPKDSPGVQELPRGVCVCVCVCVHTPMIQLIMAPKQSEWRTGEHLVWVWWVRFTWFTTCSRKNQVIVVILVQTWLLGMLTEPILLMHPAWSPKGTGSEVMLQFKHVLQGLALEICGEEKRNNVWK